MMKPMTAIPKLMAVAMVVTMMMAMVMALLTMVTMAVATRHHLPLHLRTAVHVHEM
jgi:hypothetical protein